VEGALTLELVHLQHTAGSRGQGDMLLAYHLIPGRCTF
jgi:hypothetical protein